MQLGLIVGALGLTFAGASEILAGPITLSTWYEFGFDPNHAPLVAGCQPADPNGVPCRPGIGSTPLDATPWTITVTSSVSLTLTDAFLPGDYFDLFDFGTLMGSTPAVPVSGISCGFDPSVCAVTAGVSHGIFSLAAGSHSITIDVHPAQLLGEGVFRLDAVPEPATLELLLIACCVAVFVRGKHGPTE